MPQNFLLVGLKWQFLLGNDVSKKVRSQNSVLQNSSFVLQLVYFDDYFIRLI